MKEQSVGRGRGSNQAIGWDQDYNFAPIYYVKNC